MLLEQYYWYHHVLGGALIGLASVFLMLSIGRIAGISGILGSAMDSLVSTHADRIWRFMFLLGLMVPGFILVFSSGSLPTNITSKPLVLIIAGLLVGFGASYGSGCTSGHGICGIGRLSKRSIIATLTFMAFAVVTVFIRNHVLSV